jgi:hypothetical protein
MEWEQAAAPRIFDLDQILLADAAHEVIRGATGEMEYAKRLLAETDVPLIEIRLQIGCADQSHCTALFQTRATLLSKPTEITRRGSYYRHAVRTTWQGLPSDARSSTGNCLPSAKRPQHRCDNADPAEGLSLGAPFVGCMLAAGRGMLEVHLPLSSPQMSQDSNILSRNLIDSSRRWRYLLRHEWNSVSQLSESSHSTRGTTARTAARPVNMRRPPVRKGYER